MDVGEGEGEKGGGGRLTRQWSWWKTERVET